MTILFFWYVLGWVGICCIAIDAEEVTAADCVTSMLLAPFAVIYYLLLGIGTAASLLLGKAENLTLWRKE